MRSRLSTLRRASVVAPPRQGRRSATGRFDAYDPHRTHHVMPMVNLSLCVSWHCSAMEPLHAVCLSDFMLDGVVAYS